MAAPKHVVIIGGGPSGKHAAEELLKRKGVKVTIVTSNDFVEWPIAMPKVLACPELHWKALSTDPKLFQVPEVTYKYNRVVGIGFKDKKKEVQLDDHSSIAYDALIIATGFGMPLFYPNLGDSLGQRKEQISAAGKAIGAAQCVAICGGGIVALELAGEIRVSYPTKRIVLVVKDKLLRQYSDQVRQSVEAALTMKSIEVVVGDTKQAPAEVVLQPGEFKVGSTPVSYDVFIPAYSRGPNTAFVDAQLKDDRSQIKVNEFLQSSVFPEVFAVGVNDLNEGFIGFPKLQNQWECAATNVKAFLEGTAMKKHKEGNAFMKAPPLIALGRGKTGWAMFDFSNMPPSLKCLCCNGLGGFPFCPLLLCWPCCGPCACGYCCGPPEGTGPAKAIEGWDFKFATIHFDGMASAPPQQSPME